MKLDLWRTYTLVLTKGCVPKSYEDFTKVPRAPEVHLNIDPQCCDVLLITVECVPKSSETLRSYLERPRRY